jgi:hypothetical protein
MTTTIDTTISQQDPFVFPSTRATAAAKVAETSQAAVQDTAGTYNVPLLVAPPNVGPVFIQDTEGSTLVRLS